MATRAARTTGERTTRDIGEKLIRRVARPEARRPGTGPATSNVVETAAEDQQAEKGWWSPDEQRQQREKMSRPEKNPIGMIDELRRHGMI